jgi:hypothetical protein
MQCTTLCLSSFCLWSHQDLNLGPSDYESEVFGWMRIDENLKCAIVLDFFLYGLI